MMYILNKSQAAPANWAAYLGVGIFGGIGMMASAWYVGKSAADRFVKKANRVLKAKRKLDLTQKAKSTMSILRTAKI